MITEFSHFPELTTGRFILKEIQVTDAPILHLLRSDETTNALIGRENSKGVHDALSFIERIKNSFKQNAGLYWVICLTEPSDLIGTIGFWNFDQLTDSAEIGYELLTGFRGQAIMNDVLPRIIKFGFKEMKLASITASTTEENVPSVKLLEKFGFTLLPSEKDQSPDADPELLAFVLWSSE